MNGGGLDDLAEEGKLGFGGELCGSNDTSQPIAEMLAATGQQRLLGLLWSHTLSVMGFRSLSHPLSSDTHPLRLHRCPIRLRIDTAPLIQHFLSLFRTCSLHTGP